MNPSCACCLSRFDRRSSTRKRACKVDYTRALVCFGALSGVSTCLGSLVCCHIRSRSKADKSDDQCDHIRIPSEAAIRMSEEEEETSSEDSSSEDEEEEKKEEEKIEKDEKSVVVDKEKSVERESEVTKETEEEPTVSKVTNVEPEVTEETTEKPDNPKETNEEHEESNSQETVQLIDSTEGAQDHKPQVEDEKQIDDVTEEVTTKGIDEPEKPVEEFQVTLDESKDSSEHEPLKNDAADTKPVAEPLVIKELVLKTEPPQSIEVNPVSNDRTAEDDAEEFNPPSVREAIAQLNMRQPQEIEQSRLVYHEVPEMNSHTNNAVSKPSLQIQKLSLTTSEGTMVSTRRDNVPQCSIYHRTPPEPRNVINPNWYGQSVQPVRNVGPQPVMDTPTIEAGGRPQCSTPPRKLSATTPYIGSHVIAAETGPSLTVLLRRPNSERQWGFTFYGGAEFGCPPFINKVNRNSLAFQNGLETGDVVVSICRTLTVGKTHDQLRAEFLRAGNDLDLVLIRRGVDLNKLNQIVPQVLPTTATVVMSAAPDFGVSSNGTIRPRTGQSLPRGRSFRTIKTKSVRILEEQLASGQPLSSVLTTKEHYHGARGLPAAGTSSSYTRAYGQSSNAGYAGRPGSDMNSDCVSWTTAPVAYASPSPSVVYNQPSYSTGFSVSPRSGGMQNPQLHPPYAPSWDTQSDRGRGQWNAPTQQSWHHPQQMTIQPQYPVYPASNYTNQSYVPIRNYNNMENFQQPVRETTRWQGPPI